MLLSSTEQVVMDKVLFQVAGFYLYNSVNFQSELFAFFKTIYVVIQS